MNNLNAQNDKENMARNGSLEARMDIKEKAKKNIRV